jgi:hypothetical protein
MSFKQPPNVPIAARTGAASTTERNWVVSDTSDSAVLRLEPTADRSVQHHS